MTHYDVLGVDPAASDREIRRVYLELARRHHPDFHTGADPRDRAAADRRMREINQAWGVLGDPGRREAYDLGLRVGPSSVVDRTPKRPWRPLEPDDPDEPDPRDLVDDTPIGDGSRPPRALTLAVVVFFAGAVGAFCVGMVTRLSTLLALSLVLLLLAVLSLIAAPLIALSKSWQESKQ